jgi:cytosine/uracil/thiamine/allantoin permease
MSSPSSTTIPNHLLTFIPQFRHNTSLHTLLTLLSAFAGLVSAIVATSFFYGINASDVTATIQSWSCHWSDVEMTSEPDFHRICKQAEAGLYLTVMMIPLFALIGAVGIMAIVQDKKVNLMAARKGSPALS